MASMKVIVIKKFGSVDVLEVADVPKPSPNDRELLIKVRS
jgi:NADPH:quinone reductase-like Zn-dependent oxidoreductase